MHVQPSSAYRMLLIITVLGLVGCSKEGAQSGSTLLAPNAQAGRALGTEPNEARLIELPFAASNFVGGVQNPYFPLIPGTVYSYVEETADGQETNQVEVTGDTKVILGVTTTVIHDRVYLNGALKEDTFDWYAPDKDGNVWYLGEDTKEIVNDVPVSTAGSWEAGKNGAVAGIIMLAHPKVGDTYFQENAPGVVADQGRVKSLNETVTVPYGTFTQCLKTADWTKLEPGNRAFKYYASGIGVVLEISNHGADRLELTGLSRPTAAPRP